MLMDALQHYREDFEGNPTLNLFQSWGKIWERQRLLAEFFHADAGDIFLRPNVTMVLNCILLGL